MEFYHVDRLGILSMGTHNLFPGENAVINKFFPGGISRYGKAYLGNEQCFAKFANYNLSGEPQVKLKDILSLSFDINKQPVNFDLNDFEDKCVSTSSYLINLIFELVRRSEFPDKPSRYQSMFVWESLEEAIAFQEQQINCPGPNMDIYKIQGENFFEADSTFLKSGLSIPDILNFACKYWSGERSQNPKIEILLPYPVKVMEVMKIKKSNKEAVI